MRLLTRSEMFSGAGPRCWPSAAPAPLSKTCYNKFIEASKSASRFGIRQVSKAAEQVPVPVLWPRATGNDSVSARCSTDRGFRPSLVASPAASPWQLMGLASKGCRHWLGYDYICLWAQALPCPGVELLYWPGM